MSRLSWENKYLVLSVLAVLAGTAYWRFVWQLPLISDDYLVIGLSLDWGPPSGWLDLLLHPLYRNRATSILLTYWTYCLFGLAPAAYSLVSLALHVVNAGLIYSFGAFQSVGWRVAAIAAGFFTVYEGHQEAVIWFSALPELLVFFFALAALRCWMCWLERRDRRWLAGAFVLFLGALLSKESAVAVVPLLALTWWWHRALGDLQPIPWKQWLAFVALAAAYTAWAFLGKQGNHHFSDGTFDLHASFALTMWNSMGRMLWFWGLVAALALAAFRPPRWRPWIVSACGWMVITLLPYSFLKYMPRVPSRHTYLAAAGLAMLVSFAVQTIWMRRRETVPLLLAALLIHNCGYLWVRKHHQYLERAAPTEQLIRAAAQSNGPLLVRSFPYSREIAAWAVKLAVHKPGVAVLFDPSEAGPLTPVFSWTQ